MDIQYPDFETLLSLALREDIGTGDITTIATVLPESRGDAEIVCKEPVIVSGVDIINKVFNKIDPDLNIIISCMDGDELEKGTVIAGVSGRHRSILAGERIVLNFLQRLSGIATQTRELVTLIKDIPVRLVDTRKTTPGLRALEKMAVRCGGAFNHRFGLYDGILIKDNHIRARGSIKEAVAAARVVAPHTLCIEVEVEGFDQLAEAIAADVDIVLLDNFSISGLKKAVLFTDKRVLLEASGGINKDNLRAVAETGVDFISMGWLTHSVRAVDISLDILN